MLNVLLVSKCSGIVLDEKVLIVSMLRLFGKCVSFSCVLLRMMWVLGV